ncbi:MAG: nitroreductase family protein [Elusimicrobiota bacterium]|jgi:nitroreductase|nr:nitroreductase family protein [Elusimicrobiota bacterium]
METIEAIYKRRSIRKFTDKPMTAQQIETLLKAAMMAPTGRNMQEWEFLVIQDRQTLSKMAELLPNGPMLKEAPCAIVICADMDIEMAAAFYAGDCGAAAQNILLAATDMGLGSVWLGVQNNAERIEKVKKFFNLPKNIEPFNIIALGYSAEEKGAAERYNAKKVRFEKW